MGLAARVEGGLVLTATVAIASIAAEPRWWLRVLVAAIALIAWPIFGRSYYSISPDHVTLYRGRRERSIPLEDVHGVCIGSCDRDTYRRGFLPLAVMSLQNGARVVIMGIRYPVVLKGGREVADAAVRELAAAIEQTHVRAASKGDREAQRTTSFERSWRAKVVTAALVILMFMGLVLEASTILVLPFLALFAVFIGPIWIGIALLGLLFGVSVIRTLVRLRFISTGGVWRGSPLAKVCLSVVTLGNVALALGGIAWVFVRPEAVEGLDVILGSVVAGGLLFLRVSGPLGPPPLYVAR